MCKDTEEVPVVKKEKWFIVRVMMLGEVGRDENWNPVLVISEIHVPHGSL